jgi:putative spermidine/putrescine transport system permease protein
MSSESRMSDEIRGAKALRRSLARVENRKRLAALTLTLPLLAFLVFVLFVPIGALLVRAVENPEIASSLNATSQALHTWDRKSTPSNAIYAALLVDLRGITDTSQAGAVARRLNSDIPGGRSLFMGTYKAIDSLKAVAPESAKEQLIALDARWSEIPYWQAIAKNASRWTPDYVLASVDLRRDADGNIQAMPENQRVYSRILLRTFEISAVATLWCLLLGYPLAYWLSTMPARRANVLMILVLVPFWTSILVRVAAWIVLLQREGLVNKTLMASGVLGEPMELLFNRVGVLIAMVHILLPFMILPLYSVMKSVPATYIRAAVSMGSPPLSAFFRVYVPQTYPGIGAGALLVFILSIGYYITPALLGGVDDQMISYYIARYTNVEINWGMACALGGVLLTATLALYGVYRRFGKSEFSLG